MMYKSFFRDSPLQLEFVWIEWLRHMICTQYKAHFSLRCLRQRTVMISKQIKARSYLQLTHVHHPDQPIIPVRSEKFVDGLQKLGFFNAPASLEVPTWYEDIRKDSWWLGGQFRVESGTDAKIKHVEVHNCKGSRFMVGLWEWSCINLSWGLKCHPKILW